LPCVSSFTETEYRLFTQRGRQKAFTNVWPFLAIWEIQDEATLNTSHDEEQVEPASDSHSILIRKNFCLAEEAHRGTSKIAARHLTFCRKHLTL
jgi:hypothetical protein